MLERPIILIDMDETTVRTSEYWTKRLKEEFNVEPKKELQKCYHVKEWYPSLSEEEVYSILYEDDFFEKLEPFDGALETIKEWLEVGYDARFVSVVHPQNKEGYKGKMNWIEEHIPEMLDRTCIFSSHDKTLMYGSVVIDDHPSHIEDARWAMPIIHDRPWNRNLLRRKRAKNWTDVKMLVANHLQEKGLSGRPTSKAEGEATG